MPKLFQYMSLLSPYGHAIGALSIIRFGYGICPCNDSTLGYLRTRKPTFSYVAQNMGSLFVYYWADIAEPGQAPNYTTTESTLSVNVSDCTFVDSVVPLRVGNELTISQNDRNQFISLMESREIDPSERLANLMVKSFSLGRKVTTCASLRSEPSMFMGTPTDDYLPYLFLGFVFLLICFQVFLLIVVRYRISKHV